MLEEIFTILAFLPAFLILYFFYRQDKNRKEPRSVIVKVFFVGFIVAFFAAFLNFVAFSLVFGNNFPSYFGVAESFKFGFIPGFIEESLKIICVLLLVYGLKKFDERADGIFYTVTVGMGFAAIENFDYVLGFASQGYGFQIAFARALSAVPMHAIVGAIMGYFIGKAKFSEGGKKIPLFLAGWFVAVLIHGTYNSSLAAVSATRNIGFALAPILLILGGGTIAILLMKKLVKEDRNSINFSSSLPPQGFAQQQPSIQSTPFQKENIVSPPLQQSSSQQFVNQQNQSSVQKKDSLDKFNQQGFLYCPNCGTKLVEGASFCPNCGTKIR